MSAEFFWNPLIGKLAIERARLSTGEERFSPLPESEKEALALGRLYGVRQSKVYVGGQAREDRFKTEGVQAKVLHFATHGILNNASPMYSHLALAQGDKNEDGLLEAWELMQLDLNADFAVLSACETARGRFGAGEGMIGLSWAMFMAGVPTTVVSQWKVESASTRELMLSFHGQLKLQSPGNERIESSIVTASSAKTPQKSPDKPSLLLGRFCCCGRWVGLGGPAWERRPPAGPAALVAAIGCEE